MINLDHAATTPVRAEVLDAMLLFFRECAGNPSGLYAAGRAARRAIDDARSAVARAVGARPQEVTFTSGGTESDNWALFGRIRASKDKRHLVTSSIEHHAVLNACHALEMQGVEVTYLPVDAQGRVDPRDVAEAIRPDTVLVSVMLANNEVGTLQPVREICEIAHQRGVPVHTDAVQAAGHVPVDMRALGVDLLSLSAHKFGGPKGVGALAVREGVALAPLLYGGAQERGMRPGTENTPAIVGMGRALELAVSELPETMAAVSLLRDKLLQGIQAVVPGVRVNGSMEQRLPGNLHISIPGAQTDVLLMRLDMEGIAASAGSACAAGVRERSHVLRAMGAVQEGQADLRLTLGRENTSTDVERTVDALARIFAGQRIFL